VDIFAPIELWQDQHSLRFFLYWPKLGNGEAIFAINETNGNSLADMHRPWRTTNDIGHHVPPFVVNIDNRNNIRW